MRLPAFALSCALAMALGAAADAKPANSKRAQIISAEGETIGTATFSPSPHGVVIAITIEDGSLEPDRHGFHLHEVGDCDWRGGFESAGDHIAIFGNEHGYYNNAGAHAGDLPNLFVGEDGGAEGEFFNAMVMLFEGDNDILDEDGFSLIIHAGQDDYSTEPDGRSGDRVACGDVDPDE